MLRSGFSWQLIPSLVIVSLQLMLGVSSWVLESPLVTTSLGWKITGVFMGLNVKLGSGWSLKK